VIGTIVVPTLVKLKQLVGWISWITLNLIEHVSIFVELVFAPLIYDLYTYQTSICTICLDNHTSWYFQRAMPKTFFQIEIREMEIDETLV